MVGQRLRDTSSELVSVACAGDAAAGEGGAQDVCPEQATTAGVCPEQATTVGVPQSGARLFSNANAGIQ